MLQARTYNVLAYTQLLTLTLDVLRELNLMFILPWVDYLQKDCVSP